MAVVVSGVVGYLLLFALTLAIQDIGAVLDTHGCERQRRAAGDRDPDRGARRVAPGRVFAALAAMAMWFCGLSAVTWSSRVDLGVRARRGRAALGPVETGEPQTRDARPRHLALGRDRVPGGGLHRRVRGRDVDQHRSACISRTSSRSTCCGACARRRATSRADRGTSGGSALPINVVAMLWVDLPDRRAEPARRHARGQVDCCADGPARRVVRSRRAPALSRAGLDGASRWTRARGNRSRRAGREGALTKMPRQTCCGAPRE